MTVTQARLPLSELLKAVEGPDASLDSAANDADEQVDGDDSDLLGMEEVNLLEGLTLGM